MQVHVQVCLQVSVRVRVQGRVRMRVRECVQVSGWLTVSIVKKFLYFLNDGAVTK